MLENQNRNRLRAPLSEKLESTAVLWVSGPGHWPLAVINLEYPCALLGYHRFIGRFIIRVVDCASVTSLLEFISDLFEGLCGHMAGFLPCLAHGATVNSTDFTEY